jgi:hypothetical protein
MFPALATSHLVSRGNIHIDHIRAIYVPENRIAEAKRLLSGYSSEMLSSVKGSDIFDYY